MTNLTDAQLTMLKNHADMNGNRYNTKVSSEMLRSLIAELRQLRGEVGQWQRLAEVRNDQVHELINGTMDLEAENARLRALYEAVAQWEDAGPRGGWRDSEWKLWRAFGDYGLASVKETTSV